MKLIIGKLFEQRRKLPIILHIKELSRVWAIKPKDFSSIFYMFHSFSKFYKIVYFIYYKKINFNMHKYKIKISGTNNLSLFMFLLKILLYFVNISKYCVLKRIELYVCYFFYKITGFTNLYYFFVLLWKNMKDLIKSAIFVNVYLFEQENILTYYLLF